MKTGPVATVYDAMGDRPKAEPALWLMRDEHTLLKLPLDVEAALAAIKADRWHYGMLAKGDFNRDGKHVHFRGDPFPEAEARAWLVEAVADAKRAEGAEPPDGNWIAADDHYRNVRALDVALNGEDGAAARPLLIDVLSQVQAEVRKRGRPLLAEGAEPARMLLQDLRAAFVSLLVELPSGDTDSVEIAMVAIGSIDSALAARKGGAPSPASSGHAVQSWEAVKAVSGGAPEGAEPPVPPAPEPIAMTDGFGQMTYWREVPAPMPGTLTTSSTICMERAAPAVPPDLRLQPKFDECHTAEPSLHELILRYYGHHFSPEETARYVLRYEAAFAATPPVPVVPALTDEQIMDIADMHAIGVKSLAIPFARALLAARPAEQDTARDALQDAATELEEAARLAEPDYPATADRYRFTASRCRAAIAERSAR